jgi:hypothetical protein
MHRGFVVAVAWALAGCAGPTSKDAAVPTLADWQQIKNHTFSFLAPPSLTKADVTGIDTFVEEYVSERLVLHFDYGTFASTFNSWPKDIPLESMVIDGHPAALGVQQVESRGGPRYVAMIHLNGSGPRAPLTMTVIGHSPADIAVARRIFSTITFNLRKS